MLAARIQATQIDIELHFWLILEEFRIIECLFFLGRSGYPSKSGHFIYSHHF